MRLITFADVTSINQLVMKRRKQEYILRKPNVVKDIVFQFRHRYEYIQDNRIKTIKKAGYIITAITYRQPFDDGNKSTALVVGLVHLEDNGLDLPLVTEKQAQEVFSLLNELMISTKSYEDTEKFLIERVVNRV